MDHVQKLGVIITVPIILTANQKPLTSMTLQGQCQSKNNAKVKTSYLILLPLEQPKTMEF